MTALAEALALVALTGLLLVGLPVAAGSLWLRRRRRRLRAELERVLDRLAAEASTSLAAGGGASWALGRYRRLGDDLARTRTWRGLQRLLWRERLLDRAGAVGRAAADAELAAGLAVVVAGVRRHRAPAPGAR